MTTDSQSTKEETLKPCPWCPTTRREVHHTEGGTVGIVIHDVGCFLAATERRQVLTPRGVEKWNSRVSVEGGVPTVDVPELETDDDFMLVADAINVARRVQEFIWADCYPLLRPYDAEGWRRLFQKRVDCIAEVDLTRQGGLAALRKRLLQQAALSIKALALVNRWAKANPALVVHRRDGDDGASLRVAVSVAPQRLCLLCGHHGVAPDGTCLVPVPVCSDDYHGTRRCGCKCRFPVATPSSQQSKDAAMKAAKAIVRDKGVWHLFDRASDPVMAHDRLLEKLANIIQKCLSEEALR